jgi:hypothetical protein
MDQAKEVLQSIFSSDVAGKDPMAEVMNTNPQLMLNMLSLPNQDLTGCLSNCSNRGVCGINADNKFGCKCEEFFVGDSCQTDTRACSYTPCKNNANCSEVIVPNQPNSFNCTCTSALYYGLRCENKINVCINTTCSGHGACFDNSSIPTCRCFNNYFGNDCEKKSETLKAIQQTISVTSYVAVSFLNFFFIGIFMIDYFSFIHPFIIKLILPN